MMKAVLHSGPSPQWVGELGAYTWGTLPVANRPVFEYWLALCLTGGIQDVWIILNEGADWVEACFGQGERMGLNIHYTFIRADAPPKVFFDRTPEAWQDGGMLYVRQPLFPTRLGSGGEEALFADGESFALRDEEGVAAFISRDTKAVRRYVETGEVGDDAQAFCEAGFEMTSLQTMRAYYRTNMRLVGGELDRYPAPGYVYHDGVSFGYNVITPRSAALQPPLLFGNECRVGRMCEIGPNAIVGNHIVIDQDTHLQNCVILDNSYIGRNMDIDGKIVAGRRLADAEQGVIVTIDDTWMLSPVRAATTLQDALRAVVGWLLALCMVVLQTVPYVLFRLFGHTMYEREQVDVLGRRQHRLTMIHFRPRAHTWVIRLGWAMLLDRYPSFCQVVTRRLWLCGQHPMASDNPLFDELPCYFPAVLTYADEREIDFPELEQVDDRLYIAQRSLWGDLRLFLRVVMRRWLLCFVENPADLETSDD